MADKGKVELSQRGAGFQRRLIGTSGEEDRLNEIYEWVVMGFFDRSRYGRSVYNPRTYGVVVRTDNRWFDLSAEEFWVRQHRENWLGYDAELPSLRLNSPLGGRMSELLERVGVGSRVPAGLLGSEPSSIDKRLSKLEDWVESLDRKVTRPDVKLSTNQEEVKGWGRSDSEIREKPEVKATVVNLASIAGAVNGYAVTEAPVWVAISESFPGAKMFAIDADPRSFEVFEQGDFDGRANILISVPQTLRSGRQAESSVLIPAMVSGKLSPEGEIEISEIKINYDRH